MLKKLLPCYFPKNGLIRFNPYALFWRSGYEAARSLNMTKFVGKPSPYPYIGKIRPVLKVVIFSISAIKDNLWYSQYTST